MVHIAQEAIKTQDVARLLDSVPEWFGRPESNQEYIEASQELPNWVEKDDSGQIVGMVTIEKYFPQSWDVFLMVVDREHHRQGIGKQLLAKVEEDALADNVKLLQVKTLGESHPDQFYALTRSFYLAQGFIPLEETDLWGEDTPCLIMVKPLQ